MRTTRRSEKGGAMIESALIILVFMMVVIAILDFGQAMFFHHALSERVRFAARYGALHFERGCSTACIQNLVVYKSPTIPANGRSADGLTIPRLSASNVAVLQLPDGSFNSRVVVAIQNYRLGIISPWMNRNGYLNLRAITASSPVEVLN